MDIKERDYFITNQGEIGQVVGLCVAGNCINTDIGIVLKSNIIEFNSDLKALVHPGDYVNGKKVTSKALGDTEIEQIITKKKFDKSCYVPKGNNIKEVWRAVKDFPKYEVSDLGAVRNKQTGKYIQYMTDREQCSVRMTFTDGRRLRRSVAVLVLEAFIGESEGRIPKFKDGDNQNCKLENLEWETKTEQANRILPKNSNTKLRFKYTNIVGYLEGKPVVHANNTRDLTIFLKMHFSDFVHTSMSHLGNSIKNGRPYKGIIYTCVSDYEFEVISKEIDNNKFIEIYETIRARQTQAVNKKALLPKKSEQRHKEQESIKKPPLQAPEVKNPVTKAYDNKPTMYDQGDFTDDPIYGFATALEDDISMTTDEDIVFQYLDTLSDEDFEREQELEEQRKRDKFKEELMRRLNQ